MDRSSSAALSWNELELLRRIGDDPLRPIPSGYRRWFLSMNLIQLNADQPTLTGERRCRLQIDKPRENDIQWIIPGLHLSIHPRARCCQPMRDDAGC
jgi:hypothetical protein